MVFGVFEAKGFGGGGFGVFVIEAGGEEGGVVAEEFFVEDPMGGVFADVDVDEGVGEESGEKEGGGLVWGESGQRAHRVGKGGGAYSLRGLSVLLSSAIFDEVRSERREPAAVEE